MINLSRKTTLLWVLAPTAFQAINQTALVVLSRPLGTSVTVVNKMLACSEEMEMLLPEVLGVSPKTNSNDWQRELQLFWHNFGFDVPESGMVLNTSMTFDMSDFRRKEHIEELAERLGVKLKGTLEVKDDAEKKLFNHIVKNVKEEDRYRYMVPENVEEYLRWRFCLIHAKVANEPSFIINSTKIEFYLLDDSKLQEIRRKTNDTKNAAIAKYSEILASENANNRIENLLIANDSILSITDLKELKDGDKSAMLLDIAVQTPESFITLVSDPISEDKAEVKKWVMAGFVRNELGTSIYTDASNPSIILGRTLEEVVTYIHLDVNAAYVNDLRLRYKAITN